MGRTLGNIVTGNDAQTDSVLAAMAVPGFAKLLQHPKMNIVKEAAWTISNITAGNHNQIQVVIEAGVLTPLSDILATAQKLEETDKVAMMIEECGGLDRIENLQTHENEAIYHKALQIIETFFPDENAEDEGL